MSAMMAMTRRGQAEGGYQGEHRADAAIAAMRRMNEIARENGISEMSMEEIDEEIAVVRRRKRSTLVGAAPSPLPPPLRLI